MGADPAMLLDGRQAAQDRVFADLDMAAERGVVDHDDVVADDAVMGNMGADHQEARFRSSSCRGRGRCRDGPWPVRG